MSHTEGHPSFLYVRRVPLSPLDCAHHGQTGPRLSRRKPHPGPQGEQATAHSSRLVLVPTPGAQRVPWRAPAPEGPAAWRAATWSCRVATPEATPVAVGSSRCPRGWCQALGSLEDPSPGLCVLAALQLPAEARTEPQGRLLRPAQDRRAESPSGGRWQDADLCLEHVEDGSRAQRAWWGARGRPEGSGGREEVASRPWHGRRPQESPCGSPGEDAACQRAQALSPALADPGTRQHWAGRSSPQHALTAWWSLFRVCVEASGRARQRGQRRAGGAATQSQG